MRGHSKRQEVGKTSEKEAPVAAVFTFFSKTTCGYCHQFKGDTPGPNGTMVTSPTGHWEKLTGDADLKNSGVKFILFKFGPEKDPTTGKVVTYGLDEPYASKIKGVPYLELRLPGDVNSGVPFDAAPRDYDTVKKWILQTMKKEPFKSHADGIKSGKITSTAIQMSLPPRAPSAHDQELIAMSNQQPTVQVQQAPSQIQQPQQVVMQPAQQNFMNKLQERNPSGSLMAATATRTRPEQGKTSVNTFGMGTQPIPQVIVPESEPTYVAKRRPAFGPKNV
jgi:hypothetical protein